MDTQIVNNVAQHAADQGLCTLSDARRLAYGLRAAIQRAPCWLPGTANAIWLFGSVAREYVGADLDLILEVDEETFDLYLSEAEDFCGYVSGAPSHRERRFAAACAALSLYRVFTGAANIEWSAHDIDLHIFPMNWRDRLAELQALLGHHDPKFMENVAREAIQL